MGYYRRVCQECQIPYKGWGTRFCSRLCANIYVKKHPRVSIRLKAICLNCSSPFDFAKKEKRRTFCSHKCYIIYKMGDNSKLFYEKLPVKKKYYNLISRSRILETSICTKIEFVAWYEAQVKICSYCDIPEEVWQSSVGESEKLGKKFLTIDRKDNSRGYTIDNMCFSCWRCNLIKNQYLTYDEMKYVGEHFIKPKWVKLISTKENIYVR